MQISASPMSRQRIPPLFFLVALVWSFLPVVSAPVLAAQSIGALKANPYAVYSGTTPPTYADCVAKGRLCYSPQAIRKAYNVNAGLTGKGQTIVIIDSYGSPTALADLQKFDQDYKLPDPPSFQQLAPIGSVAFDPKNADQVGWAEETSLDIQWSHAMAPRANIVVLTSPVSETQGVQGMPEFLQLLNYALDNHLGNIISQSWATTENTLFTPEGKVILDEFNAFYKKAAEHHITVLSSAGDAGVANPDVSGTIYPFPTAEFPASSPWVTAVGGTSLFAKQSGEYQMETVWNNTGGGATGGGISQYFPVPDYQLNNLPAATLTTLNGKRGFPDIAINADPRTGVPVYLGFLGGYFVFGGTSEGSPLYAGIVADANQHLGHPVGFLNTKVYQIGHKSSSDQDDFRDVTFGNNSQATIAGYPATPGWDLTTGWGTPNVSKLVKDL